MNRIIEQLTPAEKAYMRQGRKTWEAAFMFKNMREKPNKVNLCWFGDHHQFDCFVVDTKRRAIRPWVTLWYNIGSGEPVGYCLSECPNSQTIMEAFTRAVAEKRNSPICGLPVYVYTDNGKDYRAERFEGGKFIEISLGDLNEKVRMATMGADGVGTESIYSLFDVQVVHAKEYHGWAKPVERWFRTLEDRFIREIPGYCGNSPKSRPENFDRTLKALLERGELLSMDHTAADQRVRQMEAVIGQDWAQGLTIPDRGAVMQVFENATDEELRFWQRHGDLVRGDFYNRTVGAHYQPRTKQITMDISAPRSEDKRLKQSRATTTFFHETGHLFDWQAFDGTRLQDALGDFDAILESDYIARANKLLDAAGEKPITSLGRLSVTQKHVLTQDLYTDRDLKSNISDIVGGLTNNRLTNGWGHSAEYWKRTTPKVEAVAEMFEAQMMKGERLEVMREYFPTSYDRFVETIKKLEGGGT